jgi:hypothetical protein
LRPSINHNKGKNAHNCRTSRLNHFPLTAIPENTENASQANLRRNTGISGKREGKTREGKTKKWNKKGKSIKALAYEVN